MQVIGRAMANRLRSAVESGDMARDVARTAAEFESRTATAPGPDEIDIAEVFDGQRKARRAGAGRLGVTEEQWISVAKRLAAGELTESAAAAELRRVATPMEPVVRVDDAMALAAQVKAGEMTVAAAKAALDMLAINPDQGGS